MILDFFNVFFILSAAIITAYLFRHYFFTLIVLRQENHQHTPKSLNPAFEPSVTILIPAHNEEKVIGRLLEKITKITYPKNKLQIIVIDDASTDITGQIADTYSKSNYLQVLHRNSKDGGKGKAAALNAGIKLATGEIVLCFDADYLPHPELVKRLVAKFEDPKVGGVQGRPVVLNEPQNLVTRLITLERIGGYRVDQEARNILGLIPQFGGTVGGFRRNVIESTGGFDETMLTEDTDLTFQIYLAGYKIRYIGDAECYEEAVSTWKAYWRQRYRWAKGHMQVCFKYALKILKSPKMKLKEKIDGLLLLNIYFMPLLTIVSFVLGFFLLLNGSLISGALWFAVILSFYSFVGNFAPFFEVGVGVYLDGRKRVQWLTPLMLFSFLYNVLICGKAFFDLIFSRSISNNDWRKTEHCGVGNQPET
jgi:cellulose synthase/poly-beta-1,6-N-acetylglucosamine synthase-like glycosyltransferase